MKQLVEGSTKAFGERFLGMHFFNPPRYLHLLEIIAAPETSDATLDQARRFSERTLGKGTIRAKDVPGFVANRLGVYGMLLALRMLDEFKLTIDEVDALTGPVLGRAKSATFRTADLTGLDVLEKRIDWRPQDPFHLFSLDIESAGYIAFGKEPVAMRWTQAEGFARLRHPND